MKMCAAGIRFSTLLFLSTSLFIFSSCQETEEPKIKVAFETVSATVEEGQEVTINIIMSKPARQDEYVTIGVTSSDAEFGNDYGIDNLLFLTQEFTILIPENTTTGSFTFTALVDFAEETDEQVDFIITETSDLQVGDQGYTTVTVVNVTNYAAGNRALMFDGVDDYVDLGNIYDDVALPVTVSMWVWLDPTSPSGIIPLFSSQDGKLEYSGFDVTTSTSSALAAAYGDGVGGNNAVYRRTKSALFSPVMGRWVNFTAVIRGATDMDMYFNGVDVGGSYSGSSDLPMNSNSPTETATIGYGYMNNIYYHFKGKMDELRIWNRALTQTEIQTVIFKKIDSGNSGLIGYWNFDEPAGTALIDQSSKKYNGVLKGNPTRVLSEVPVDN